MLGDELKQTIQKAYSQVLERKKLRPRRGQKVMIAEIARMLAAVQTMTDDEPAPFCVLEAGTGTGKTLAYTLAVIPLAKALNKKVVIATATVALQEQIVFRDLPDIQQHSGLTFSFALAKGRSRYVCLSKLDNVLTGMNQQNPIPGLYPDEMGPLIDPQSVQIYQSMLDALATNRWEGDRDSWPEQIDDVLWYGLTSDRNQCTGRRCANVNQCSFFKAREDLHSVDCIVTNHDLVMADLALGGGAILPDPADTIYIFDEGHHLPGRALNHFSYSCRLQASKKWLDQLLKSAAVMAKQLAVLKSLHKVFEQLPGIAGELKQYTDLVQPLLESLLQQDNVTENDGKLLCYRFSQGIIPQSLCDLSLELYSRYGRLLDLLSRIHNELGENLDDEFCEIPQAELETWFGMLGQWLARAEAYYGLWGKYAHASSSSAVPDARWVTVLESGGNIDLELSSSPILASEQLQQNLWARCYAAIVTSATLSSLGSFERFRMQSGLPANSVYKQVQSPFDYQSATLHVPAMSCEPNQPDLHTQAIVELLPTIVDRDEGSLLLFASRRQMLDVYADLSGELRELVLMQGDHSKMELLRLHCEKIDNKKGSIIFGLASFAEGVDLPGRYCSHVIIAKIPFAVPDNPVEAALAEWISARGGNPFMEIAVPDAALRLVQASGRLLRSETDVGRITLLDRRIVSKRYGKAILDSLPPYRRLVV
jgi:ATP-dependent DNA helicase DinG